MALAGRTIRGGVLITGIPDEADTLNFTTDALNAAAGKTLLEFNIAFRTQGSNRIRGGMCYIVANPSASLPAGARLYVAPPKNYLALHDGSAETVEHHKVGDPEVLVIEMGEGDELPVAGPPRNVVATTGISGQVTLDADAPALTTEDLPIWRYCAAFSRPPIDTWTERDRLGSVSGTIHESNRDPVNVTPTVTVTDSSVVREEASGTGYIIIQGSTPVLANRRSFQYLSLAWTLASDRFASGRTNLRVTGDLGKGVENTLRMSVEMNGQTHVFGLGRGTGGTYNSLIPYTSTHVQIGLWLRDVRTGAAATVVFSGLGPAGDGASGDVWVRDSRKAWKRSGNNWALIAGLDLSAGAKRIRVIGGTDELTTALGAVGDFALLGDTTQGRVRRWERTNVAQDVKLAISSFPEHITGLPNGTPIAFTLSTLNLNADDNGGTVQVTATPEDSPPAAPERTPELFVQKTGVAAQIDPVDDDTEVRLEYRDRETDDMGMEVGFQTVREGTGAAVQRMDGLTQGQEARFRILTARSPAVAGTEVVVPQVGHALDGLPIEDGYYDRQPSLEVAPGDCYRVYQELIAGVDGSLKLVHHHAAYDPRNRRPEFREVGAHRIGGNYLVGDVATSVIRVAVSATSTADHPRKFICIKAHNGAAADTVPGIGDNWRDYWRGLGEFVRYFVSGDNPDAVDDVDDAEETDRAEDDFNEVYILQMNNVVGPTDGTGGLRGVGEAGEFAFVYRSATGPVRLIDWTLCHTRTTTLVVALIDRLGVVRDGYHRALRGGDHVRARWSDGRWIRFVILSAAMSADGRKCVMEVLPVSHDSTDGDGPVVDGNMDFLFDRAPEVVTTPTASPVPTVPQGLVVRHLDQSGSADRFNDYLELSITAPASGNVPFVYEVRLHVRRFFGDRGVYAIRSYGGPEVRGQRYWDGDLANTGTADDRVFDLPIARRGPAGVDAAGKLIIPRQQAFPYNGDYGDVAASDIFEAIDVRAGNPDGDYGPRLTVTGADVLRS